ncbi:MAG: elongation factor Ts [Proteobacteria bacterium]|nr:elongation factor Ts [Pseudomonadota bacterium]
MSITPEMVKELREKTGAGMMDCKTALAESSGNMDSAVEILRKKGVATAARKAGRTAADGLIGYSMSDDARVGVLVEVNCETDFVTKTDDFRAYVAELPGVIRDANPADLDALMGAAFRGSTVREAQTALVAKIGENLGVRRFSRVEADAKGRLAQYIHAGSKIGVIVKFRDPNRKLDETTAREVAMHVAAMHPQYVRRDDVPESVISKEKEIMLAQMGETKKPPEIMDKIVTGKMGKVFTEICLEEQIFVRDPDGKSTVGRWLAKIDDGIKVDSFVRLQVGEGVEKRKE